MISKGRIVQHVETIEAYTCDKCGLIARPEDHIEYQDFTIIRVRGGSVPYSEMVQNFNASCAKGAWMNW